MTASPARAAGPSLAIRGFDVLASEWTKLRSARSNYLTLLVAAVVTIGATFVVAHAIASTHGPPPPGPINALTGSFLAFAEYMVLPVSVLSVLVFTSEYGTGLIRTTFTAVPRRWAVLGAKAAVTGTVALLAGELLAFAAFFLTQAILSGRHGGLSFARPGVPGAVLAAGLVLAACALVGLGLGAIIRHTAGAIAATVAVICLLPAACLFLPGPWNARIGRFTLPGAAYQVAALHPQAGLLSPALSLLVLLAWPTAVLLVAAVAITRRDA